MAAAVNTGAAAPRTVLAAITSAPLPDDEAQRLQLLRDLQLLDGGADPVLDGLVAIAARALGCPIALFSLVDSGRQWFKAALGLAVRETPRELAFCAHAILGDTLLEVPDALADPRFASNPLVIGDPGIRFYAGMPVGLDGHRLGTLCVMDRKPRTLTADERTTLLQLAQAVDHWLAAHAERQALADRERSFRDLAEQIPAIVYRAGLGGETSQRYISPRLRELGHDPADWVARPSAWWLAVHPQDRDRVRRELDTAIAGDHSATLQYRMRDAQGGWHHMHDTARVVRTKVGTAPVLQGVMLDVTATVNQQDRLRKLSTAIDQSAESIFITDLQGTIEYVNDAALRLTGYHRDELLGRNPRMLKSGQTPASVHEALWHELAAGRIWKGVLHNRRKDGSALIESASISPVRDDAGAVTHYVAVKQDITENRELRAELDSYRDHLADLVARRTEALERARVEAEAANAAKSAFLAAMSHEIRTPMSGVIGVIELLERSSLTPEQKALTDTARESAAMLLALIDDILDFSKIEAGRMTLDDKPLDPAHLLETACDALQPLAAQRGVQLHVFASPALPPLVRGDAVRLRQIITNLVGNAIKFSAGMDRPGRVSARLGWQPDAGIALSVADKGIGMSAELQSRLFQPFEQADRSTSRQHGGTGLGLTICRRLIDAMDGRIALDSTAGVGSRFEVTLPLAAVPDAAPAAPAWDLTGLQCRLLVADDEWAQDWTTYLQAAGARVMREPEPPRGHDAAPGADTVWIAQADWLGPKAPPGASVLLRRGERRMPREEAPQRVVLDVPGLRRETLLWAVAIAAGRTALTDLAAEVSAIDTGMGGLKVLVAEDNETNRKVLVRQLRLLGVAADIAHDGAAALELWRLPAGRRYALLLTDLHMPHLDGYGLCAAIRAEEDPLRRLPIIALTANALRGEAERCRAAGMDDCLVKPVQIDRLRATLLRWAAPSRAAQAAPHARLRAMDIDETALQRLVGNDPSLIGDLQRKFLTQSADDLDALWAAIVRADCPAAGGQAHRWKSGAAAMGAVALAQLLEEIELACGQGRADDARALAGDLGHRFDSVRRWLGQPAPAPLAPAEARVLLVDDDPVTLQLIAAQLQSLRTIAVQAYPSAAALIDYLTTTDGRTSLALIDLNMPGMDGIELIRHLAENGFEGALALASGADRRVLETAARLAQARGLRVLGYVQKPVTTQALRDLMARWQQAPAAPAASGLPSATPHEIRRAIDGGELRLAYQPQINVATGALAGVEALVRWQHPVRGLLPPACFVPAAEEHGLVESLTRHVLDLALAQASAWQQQHGLRVRMAVNVSMDNLVRLDFAEYVVARLAQFGIAPQDLVLEVTETRLMKDLRAPLDILTRLRMRGIGLSIDDFGTGHSSLAQLRDLPFDELKVDRGFVHGGCTDPTLRAILTGSVEMAQRLGMRVVAEGVEDAADWALVRQAGCTEAQGYLVARPMPGDTLPGWLAAWPRQREALLAEWV